jgi:hypothetical protein
VTDDAHVAGNSAADVFADARWFPEGLDARAGALRLVATDRATLGTQSFLDGRWDRSGLERRSVHATALVDCMPPKAPKPAFIWHTGFCCSTLLAKALDHPGRNLPLCEPQILVELADAKRGGILARTPFVTLPQLVFQLLSRGFAPGERVTLKPSPAANTLLPEAAALTDAPMVFLYSDCRSFLISIFRMGQDGRKYVRRLFLALLNDGHPQTKWPVPKMLLLSDLELAAVVWHMQIAEFRRVWPQTDTRRVASLDCDAFLGSPVEALSRLDTLFSLELGEEHIARVVNGPLFRHNAKTGEAAFDSNRRREEHAAIERQMSHDLDRIVAESYALCGTPAGMPLPEPLLATKKIYGP